VPPVAIIDAGSPAVFVIENTAGGVTPATDAVTEYVPNVLFAVGSAEVAMPAAFVTAVFTPPAKVAEAPVEGSAKVTVTPEIGRPVVSFTNTLSGAENAV
jgi:hypothetical protein